LEILALYDNEIAEIKGINGLISLRRIFLSKNPVSKIHPFKNLPYLLNISYLDANNFSAKEIEIIKEWCKNQELEVSIRKKDEIPYIKDEADYPELLLMIGKRKPNFPIF